MSPRERFVRTMHYQHVDYVSHLEFGYWDELKQSWMDGGHIPPSFRQADGSIPDRLVEAFFGVEQFEHVDAVIGAQPLRQTVTIDRTPDRVLYRDGLGVLRREQTSGSRTIPHFVEFPIKDRATWGAFRDEYLDPAHPVRRLSPQALATRERLSRVSTNPVAIGFGSFIGWVRDWVGFHDLALLSIDDPDLVEEMVAHLSTMLVTLLPGVLARCQIDAAAGWEDICFNSGPLLSPRFFGDRIIPHMRPVMRLLRRHGVDVIWTDCDGQILELIPLWLQSGLNCMFPLEVHPGNDPVALRREYGRDLLIRGGFDKFRLWEGREAILRELQRLEPIVADGGFIPHVDHRCPAGVPFDTYCYYVREKCHMLGWPEERIREIPAFRPKRDWAAKANPEWACKTPGASADGDRGDR
jgi:uroporphyrinogen decarboxylase